jgi:hypothetical protein
MIKQLGKLKSNIISIFVKWNHQAK